MGNGTMSRILTRSGSPTDRCASAKKGLWNGRQHSLPREVHHTRMCQKEIKQMFPSVKTKDSFTRILNDKPTRPWGTGTLTRWGGEGVEDSTAEGWLCGNFWNTDSNIRLLDGWDNKREAAKTAHDIHRHDMITKLTLPGKDRVSDSGVLSADSCFLEAWGFDLGLRDRGARPTSLWRPPTRELEFGIKVRSTGLPGSKSSSRQGSRRSRVYAYGTNDPVVLEDMQQPRWDGFEHVVKREGARRSQDIHRHEAMDHGYPHDKVELRPQAIYTRKYQKFGHEAYREHDRKEPIDRSRIKLKGTWRYDMEKSREGSSADTGEDLDQTQKLN